VVVIFLVLHGHLAPLHLLVSIGPFAISGINFMTCNPSTTTNSHGYTNTFIDYFTMWVEVMPYFSNNGTIQTLFMFNHIITTFGSPIFFYRSQVLFFEQNDDQLVARLDFQHENLTPYYP